MTTTITSTYIEIEVSESTYLELRDKLLKVGYGLSVKEDGGLDLRGIRLKQKPVGEEDTLDAEMQKIREFMKRQNISPYKNWQLLLQPDSPSRRIEAAAEEDTKGDTGLQRIKKFMKEFPADHNKDWQLINPEKNTGRAVLTQTDDLKQVLLASAYYLLNPQGALAIHHRPSDQTWDVTTIQDITDNRPQMEKAASSYPNWNPDKYSGSGTPPNEATPVTTCLGYVRPLGTYNCANCGYEEGLHKTPVMAPPAGEL